MKEHAKFPHSKPSKEPFPIQYNSCQVHEISYASEMVTFILYMQQCCNDGIERIEYSKNHDIWYWTIQKALLTGKCVRHPLGFTLSQATKALRESRSIALLYFRPLHQKGVRGKRHAPAAPYPRERPGTHCTGGWVGPRAGLDWCRKSRPTGIRSPDRPARRQSLYRLRYPDKTPITFHYSINHQHITSMLRVCSMTIVILLLYLYYIIYIYHVTLVVKKWQYTVHQEITTGF